MGGRLGKQAAVRRGIDAAVKGRFVAALRAGARLADAARESGASLSGLYKARGRDSIFRAAWADALAHSSAPRLIRANNKRGWQMRRMRNVEFTDARKAVFLDHFAGTCDVVAAAEAAGVSKAVVYKHKQRDPDFAAQWQEVLAGAYELLEAEAVRQRLAWLERMRDGVTPKGEMADEFERVMKLLARYDRRGGAVGFHGPGTGRMKRWSFDEAIEALDRKLRAIGARRTREDEAAPDDGDGA